jgi:hypothetical protein
LTIRQSNFSAIISTFCCESHKDFNFLSVDARFSFAWFPGITSGWQLPEVRISVDGANFFNANLLFPGFLCGVGANFGQMFA